MGNTFGPNAGKRSTSGNNYNGKKNGRDNGSWLLWLTLIIVGIIVVLMAYLFFRPFSDSEEKSPLKADDEFTIINRL